MLPRSTADSPFQGNSSIKSLVIFSTTLRTLYAYIEIWSQSVILANDLCQASVHPPLISSVMPNSKTNSGTKFMISFKFLNYGFGGFASKFFSKTGDRISKLMHHFFDLVELSKLPSVCASSFCPSVSCPLAVFIFSTFLLRFCFLYRRK